MYGMTEENNSMNKEKRVVSGILARIWVNKELQQRRTA